MTKKDMVLNHLESHKSITSIEAFDKYNATRLSDIIFKLRKNGYNIITEKISFVDALGNKSYYGKYILVNK